VALRGRGVGLDMVSGSRGSVLVSAKSKRLLTNLE
jgi:hypothetical protein